MARACPRMNAGHSLFRAVHSPARHSWRGTQGVAVPGSEERVVTHPWQPPSLIANVPEHASRWCEKSAQGLTGYFAQCNLRSAFNVRSLPRRAESTVEPVCIITSGIGP